MENYPNKLLAKPVLYSGHAGAKERKTQVVTETVEA